MRKLLMLCLLLLAACSNPSPTPEPGIHSGIDGTVTIGPMCPVVRADEPCPDKPYQAMLTVLDSTGNKVTQFQTGADGKFHVALKPGDYVLHPELPDKMTRAGDIPFTVTENIFITVDVVYDSGIR